MPSPSAFEGQNPLLSGMFGSFQAGAAAGADTAQVWQSLRITAATYQWQAQGGGELPDAATLEETGRQILSAQGVGIQQVNQYRAIAGQWQAARTRLQNLNDSDQITAQTIFRPPWAQTAGNEIADRYRVRVGWQVTPSVGDVFTKWSSYEITAPITNIADVLDQAAAKASGDKYLYLLSGGAPLAVGSYQIEQI